MDNNSLTWVFAPGANASKTQVLKYAQVWKGDHGEVVVSRHLKGQPFIGVPGQDPRVTSVDFSEIVHRDVNWHPDWRCWPRQVFQAAVAQTIKWRHGHAFVTHSPGTQPVMDHHSLDWTRFNLGQHADMRLFGQALDAHRAKYPDQPIVLYGVSRGAATVVNFVAHATPAQLKDVAGIVLEGCPASLQSVLDCKVYYLPTILGQPLVYLIQKGFEWCTSYSSSGPTPIDSMRRMPTHIPVLLVMSQGDCVVPPMCTWQAMLPVKDKRHIQPVMLPGAGHPHYTLCEPDCSKYRDAVLSFYERIVCDRPASQTMLPGQYNSRQN